MDTITKDQITNKVLDCLNYIIALHKNHRLIYPLTQTEKGMTENDINNLAYLATVEGDAYHDALENALQLLVFRLTGEAV